MAVLLDCLYDDSCKLEYQWLHAIGFVFKRAAKNWVELVPEINAGERALRLS